MPILLSLTLTIVCLGANAGGVTVGNGQGRVIVGLSLKNDFETEFDLTQYADQIINEIHKLNFKRIIKMRRAGDCDPSYAQVQTLDVQSFYKLLNGELTLKREYVGYLKVELKECKKIKNILADEPFGGEELWDFSH